jgi:hypothetical protein
MISLEGRQEPHPNKINGGLKAYPKQIFNRSVLYIAFVSAMEKLKLLLLDIIYIYIYICIYMASYVC